MCVQIGYTECNQLKITESVIMVLPIHPFPIGFSLSAVWAQKRRNKWKGKLEMQRRMASLSSSPQIL